MIDLITGLPGNAKTAFTVAWVRAWAKKDNRAVFYSGIPLTEKGQQELGWTEIKSEEWMLAPPNSIVIIDECQKVFRNRSLGQIPPKHVTDLETHRHLGIDLVFITQHPSLIDPAIRRLTGRHRHMIRIWGTEASTVHEWASVRDNCDKPVARKDSEKAKWKFDKSVYPLYKSAEVHTVKRSIPMRVWLLMVIPFVLLACGYAVYYFAYAKKVQKPVPGVSGKVVPGVPGAAPGMPVGSAPAKLLVDPVADARSYLFNQTPRVIGIQQTAPKYDQLTQPNAVPVPAACVHSKAQKRCECYTQQATPLAVPYNVCLDVAHHGYFQEFNPDGEKRQAEHTDRSVRALNSQESLPLSRASTRDAGPSQSVANADGFGVLGKVGPGVRQPGVDSVPAQSNDQPFERAPRVPASSPWRAS